MGKMKFKDSEREIEVELTDWAMVVTILGLAAAAMTGVYMVTRNQDTLRLIAEIAKARGAILVENGRRILNG